MLSDAGGVRARQHVIQMIRAEDRETEDRQTAYP
jgi:hypothetical protein